MATTYLTGKFLSFLNTSVMEFESGAVLCELYKRENMFSDSLEIQI